MVPTVDPNYKPRRINKAIELWEDNQVVAYAEFGASGAPDTYEEGKRMAKTYCDAINYEMENDSLSFDGLRNFMQGLVDGGPTPSGHRTPMVFVTLPAWGFDGPSMRANVWQIHQSLAAGAHGVLICEMESPEAAEIAIAGGRYKWTWPGVEELPIEGVRGAGSQAFAAHIWGVSQGEYVRLADTWPHNPKGEITMGFKLENRRSAMAAEQLMAVKGLAFAEPGPSDNGWSHLGWDAVREDLTPRPTRRPSGLQAPGRRPGTHPARGQEEQHQMAGQWPARRDAAAGDRSGTAHGSRRYRGACAGGSPLYQAEDALLN